MAADPEQAEVRRLLGDVIRGEIMHAAQVDMLDQVQAALYTLTSRSAKTLAAFATGVRDGIPSLGSVIEQAHAQIAGDVQEAILDAYDRSLLGTPPYRIHAQMSKNNRYAGGMLRSVLASSSFVTSDAKGVYIGNTAQLDARARQWRRLNYGAGGRAGDGAEIFGIRWSNAEFFLEEPGAARPAFRIPGGRWIGREFYPISEVSALDRMSRRLTGRGARLAGPTVDRASAGPGDVVEQHPRMTRGIRGTHWIAAGLAVAAQDLPRAYAQILKKLWAEGDKAMTQAMADVGAVRPGTPRVTVTRRGGGLVG